MQPLLAAASMDGGETRVKGGPFSGNPTPSGPEFIGAPRRQCVERAATVIAPSRTRARARAFTFARPSGMLARIPRTLRRVLARAEPLRTTSA